MSKITRDELREMRKQALQLQADAYRLQLADDWQTLRSPFKRSEGLKGLAGALGSPLAFMEMATALLSRGRFTWIARALPLAMTGWRIANLVRGWLRRGVG